MKSQNSVIELTVSTQACTLRAPLSLRLFTQLALTLYPVPAHKLQYQDTVSGLDVDDAVGQLMAFVVG